MLMTGELQKNISFKPFDPNIHDRTAFCCGADQVDNFLKFTAKKHQKGNYTRVWVAVDDDDESRILGFYAINAHSIEVGDLPEKYVKNAPNHGTVPAAYISVFGVDEKLQGKGLGQVLLADCLKRIALRSAEIGLNVVVLDVLEDENVNKRKKFYEKAGFMSFPSMALRMFLPVQTILSVFEES